jgi:NADH-quinone oxidoreductase subunit A
MNPETVSTPDIWPLVAYFLAVMAVVGVMLGGSYLLGERRAHPAKATLEPFESGIVGTGGTLLRFAAPFYLLAIFFVIFDIEAIYIFAWAIAFRESGWAGYIEILIFIAVLLAALAYLWLIGVLDWRTARQKAADLKPNARAPV